MPLNPIDIPAPNSPEQCAQYLALAEETLRNNTQILDVVLGKLRDTVLGQIDANKKAIRKVNGKINRTVNRHIGIQSKALDTMVSKIGEAVGGQITSNAAVLNDVALRTSLAAGTATSASGALTPITAGTILYRLYIKCDTRQLGPFLASNDPTVLARAGWSLATPQTFASGGDAMQWGQMHFADIVSTICRSQPQTTLPRVGLPPPTIGAGAGAGSSTTTGRTVVGGSSNAVPPIPANGQCPNALDPRNISGSGSQLVVYVDCYGDVDNTGPGVYVVTAAQAFSQAANFAPPYGQGGRKLIAGPFQTQADAETWIAASGGANDVMSICCGVAPPGGLPGTSTPPAPAPAPTQPPPAGTPPAPTPPSGGTCPPQQCESYSYQGTPSGQSTFPPFPALQCSQLVDGKLPQVGSVEWCLCLDALKKWLDQIGLWFISGLDIGSGTSESAHLLDAFGNIIKSITGLGVTPKALEDALDNTKGRLDDHWKAFWTTIGEFAAMTATELIGISICRALVRVLHDFQFGWDAAVWATLRLEVVIDPLERLLLYVTNYTFQWEIPGVGEAIDCLLQHTAPVEQAYCWMECHGANPVVYQPVIDARREKLHDNELIEWARRHELDDDAIVRLLQDQGWYRTGEAIARTELSYELPTIQDHLHWLQRNTFDTTYVTDYQLLDGFDTEDNIRSLPGLSTYVVGPDAPQRNFWQAFGADLHSLGMRKEYAANHYAAHWIIPSTGQLAEMMQRLRPGRVDPSIQFTATDFERLLVEQDVAPYFRRRIEAIAFRTLPIRQLNSAVKHGLFNEAEVAQRWQDIGFTVEDAPLMARATVIDATRQQVSAAHGYTASVISDLAAWDLIDFNLAVSFLEPQGFSRNEVDTLFEVARKKKELQEEKTRGRKATTDYAVMATKAYADGIIDQDIAYTALRSAGYSDDAAKLEIATTSLRVRSDKILAAVKAIRKAFLRGEVNSQEALNALGTAGVLANPATDYVQRWSLEMTVPRQAATTATILKWAKEGLISVANAEVRLRNIGWKQENVNLYIAELDQSIAQAAAKAKTLRAKELAAAQAAAQKVVKDTQKEFCKLFTPAKMILWYSERIISDGTFRDRLTKCGYNAEQLDDLFKQATIARAAADAKAAKKGPAGIQYTGPGADA